MVLPYCLIKLYTWLINCLFRIVLTAWCLEVALHQLVSLYVGREKCLVNISLAVPIPFLKRKGWSLKIWSMLQKTVTPIKLHCSKFLEHLFWSYHRNI